MKLDIRTRHLALTPQAREEMERRITTALARISPWIRAVVVKITDVNGPKGGPDKQVHLRIRGRSIPSIVVEHLGTDTFATVGLAVERAVQAIVRKMARRRGFAPAFAV